MIRMLVSFCRAEQMASPSDAGSRGSTNRPVLRCLTTSGMPPTAVATTGTRHIMASAMIVGNPSLMLDSTRQSAAESQDAISSCGRVPTKTHRAEMPSRLACARRLSRSIPSPTIYKRKPQELRCETACKRYSGPFTGSKLPINSTIFTLSGRPNNVRAAVFELAWNNSSSAPFLIT